MEEGHEGRRSDEGDFTLYKKRENLYLELAPNQLDQPVLGIFSLARGIGSNFVLGGLPLNDRLLEFQRSGDRVLVLEKNTRFVTPGDAAFDKARDLSYGHSVLASLKIESIHDSSKALLVDLAPLLVSDLSDLSEGLRGSIGKSVKFDKERSALMSVKTFPENTEIEALLTYSPNDRQNYGLATVPDDRYIPITVHYSFSKLPENPMTPRLADDRTGYFLTAVKDFTRDTGDNYWRRFVNRWRLEKKDPAAARLGAGEADRVLHRSHDPGEVPALDQGRCRVVEQGVRGRGLQERDPGEGRSGRSELGSRGRALQHDPLDRELRAVVRRDRAIARRPAHG